MPFIVTSLLHLGRRLSPPETVAKGLFNHSAFLSSSSDVGDAIKHILLACELSSCLVHLGNMIFCYILTRNFADPKHPEITHLRDPEKRVTSSPLRFSRTPILNPQVEETKLSSSQNCCTLHNFLPYLNAVPLLVMV